MQEDYMLDSCNTASLKIPRLPPPTQVSERISMHDKTPFYKNYKDDVAKIYTGRTSSLAHFSPLDDEVTYFDVKLTTIRYNDNNAHI